MYINLAVSGAAVLISMAGVYADLCAMGSTNIDGNEYCQPVGAIRYSNVGKSGNYNQITNMASDGTCFSQLYEFSGALAPLDEELSLHFRGPIRLNQLAAYTPASRAKRHKPQRTQGHGHQHRRRRRRQEIQEKRQMISATIDGQLVSWENNYFGSTDRTTPTPTAAMVTATIDGQVVSWVNNWFGPSTSTVAPTNLQEIPPSVHSSTDSLSVPATTEYQSQAIPAPTVQPSSKLEDDSAINISYDRIGYYDAASQTLENLVFLGTYGGQGSGVSDTHFGASLAYCNSQGTGGATSPQILAATVVPSDSEVIVMLGQECQNGDCGYFRPGTVAYHGFGGADKIFLMEFSMPQDSSSGFNADMPAIWMLNAQIPRTLQYGNPACSCWSSGCGEFDIAETLSSGSDFLKSTIHTNEPAGDSDYVMRPITNTMKLAVIFNSANSTIRIEVLSQEIEFSTTFSPSEIDQLSNSSPGKPVSHFEVA